MKKYTFRATLIAVVGAWGSLSSAAEEIQILQEMVVKGVTPLHGVGLPENRIPNAIQSADDKTIKRAQSVDLTDFLNRNLGSVSINAALNNPLQPDVQYRGFTASPLLGLPQGITVYQNGVRLHEPFGDTVNWELLPESSIASINLMGGANPLFGLNTLGGALSIQTKNGFTHPQQGLEVYGGAFNRVSTEVQSGWNNGTFGAFGTFSYFNEDGWREASNTDVKNFFGSVGWRGQDSALDLSFNYGKSELIGNGPTPVELLALDRKAVFTSPDITENDLKMLTLEGDHWFGDSMQLSGNAFYRDIESQGFNGDGTEFEECLGSSPETAGLAEPGDFRCEGQGDEETLVRDRFGAPVEEDDNAINNISTREQHAYGGTLQQTFIQDLLGRENQLIVGGAYSQGFAEFQSEVEIARLNDDRSTTRTGRFVDDEETHLKSRVRTWSLFITDTFSITPELSLTFSGRFNSTRVVIGDLTGEQDELNGRHSFDRFNPGGGLSWQAHPRINLYGSYSESSRAPTAVELACADEDAPCNLPNAFLADPPLEQVVAKSIEGGLRGTVEHIGGIDVGTLDWNVGGFHTINNDDIIFQTTGGVSANEGFFDNIGDTRRMGAELDLRGEVGRFDWFLNYSYVDATFQDPYIASSPHHPDADDTGKIGVKAGSTLPGIPKHNFKFGFNVNVHPSFVVGTDVLYHSGQTLRGDEANRLETTDGYAVVNLRGEYRVHEKVTLFAKIENLFDKDYESFGLLGEPEEVLGDAFQNPRFLGPGAERGGWVGIRVSL